MSAALIVFARAPHAGAVKTRLIPSLGADGAAHIYERLLEHALCVAAEAPVDARAIHVDSAASLPWFAAQRGFELQVQTPGDLGARMAQACAQALLHHRRVLLMGSDLADITGADLALADAWLARDAEIVLGPVADGGYWLIGLRASHRELFEDIAWGSAGVYTATVARMARRGLCWRALPLRHDVDEVGDLPRMAALSRRVTRRNPDAHSQSGSGAD